MARTGRIAKMLGNILESISIQPDNGTRLNIDIAEKSLEIMILALRTNTLT